MGKSQGVLESMPQPRIAGGFVRVVTRDLLAVWTACVGGEPGAGGFRAWLVLREMVARREAAGLGRTDQADSPDRLPSYVRGELARLLGVSARVAKEAVARLVAAGLVTWSDDGSAITFPAAPPDARIPAALADTIGGVEAIVAIPRRLLRFLARRARPALMATALGALLRCVSRREDGWGFWGRIKASWVEQVFGVTESKARAARRELVRVGWLEPDPADAGRQKFWNRWGRAYRVCLDWCPGQVRTNRPTLGGGIGAKSAYPLINQDPPPGRRENPEPGVAGPPGACAGTGKQDAAVVGEAAPVAAVARIAELVVPPAIVEPAPELVPTGNFRADRALRRIAAAQRPVAHPAAQTGQPPARAASVEPPAIRPTTSPTTSTPSTPSAPTSTTAGRTIPPPTLRDIQPHDLKDTGRILALHEQAVKAGRISCSEADRLRFVAAAEHARAVGRANPPGLLARIVASKLWRVITQGDEDRASRRLREHDRGGPPAGPTPAGTGPRGSAAPPRRLFQVDPRPGTGPRFRA